MQYRAPSSRERGRGISVPQVETGQGELSTGCGNRQSTGQRKRQRNCKSAKKRHGEKGGGAEFPEKDARYVSEDRRRDRRTEAVDRLGCSREPRGNRGRNHAHAREV